MYSYHEIMTRMLARVPDTMNKREGEIIYDTLAQCALEFVQLYANLIIWQDQIYLMTATGENLDKKGADYAIEREKSTYAERIIRAWDTAGSLMDLPLSGSRFGVPNVEGSITFNVTKRHSLGNTIAVCEQIGSVGNEYYGYILPLVSINNLGRAEIVGTLQPGQDTEDDERYRQRILEHLKMKAFGGNITQYKQWIKAIDGVGDVMIFPAWQGGGTVLASVIDATYNPITLEFQALIKNMMDPVAFTGQGVGMVPIGHKLTVSTPQNLFIHVTADVVLDSGVSVGQIQFDVEKNISDYLLGLRQSWAQLPFTSEGIMIMYIFISRINEAIIKVQGVINVLNIRINGSSNDLIINNKANLQSLPMLGDVRLSG